MSLTWPVLAALGVVLLLVLLAGVRLGRWRSERVVRRRVARSRRLGAQGEADGLWLLEEAGYRVMDTQVTGEIVVVVDGRPETHYVRADALVSRRGREFVAELKSTSRQASVANRATRRQLMEYVFAFDPDGVLLVDAEAGEVHTVVFPD